MKHRRWNVGAAVSTGLCAVLALAGTVRLLSYTHGAWGEFVRRSFLSVFAYKPDSPADVRFFKILATPSVVAVIYFFFRWRNSSAPSHLGAIPFDRVHRLDFESPILRGVLTTVITLHWLAIEWWKFNVEGFYPWSALENRALNIVVLLVGQAIAFWGMKYLSFDPIFVPDERPAASDR